MEREPNPPTPFPNKSVCTQFARALCKPGHQESSPDADKGVGGDSDALSEGVATRDVVIPCPPESSAERSTPGGNRTHNRQLRRPLFVRHNCHTGKGFRHSGRAGYTRGYTSAPDFCPPGTLRTSWILPATTRRARPFVDPRAVDLGERHLLTGSDPSTRSSH